MVAAVCVYCRYFLDADTFFCSFATYSFMSSTDKTAAKNTCVYLLLSAHASDTGVCTFTAYLFVCV